MPNSEQVFPYQTLAQQLVSALEREERLRGLLQMCSNHIGSRAGEGAIEVMREIKAAVTGE